MTVDFDGRDYLLPRATDPAWLAHGRYELQWVVTSGPSRGERFVDHAAIVPASDTIRAQAGGPFTYPYVVELAPRARKGRRPLAARTWLVQHVRAGRRDDPAPRFGLTIIDDIPRGFDGGGVLLQLTQLDSSGFVAAWRSWHQFTRWTWYGRRIREPDAGYVCARRIGELAVPPQ